MTVPHVIDIESLLSPISEERPLGEEINVSDVSGPLYLIKSAWEIARKREREAHNAIFFGATDNMGQVRKLEAPEWKPVLEKSIETIQSKSKDLRVAAWLTDALIREHGLVGLRDGLALCWGLCEKHWDNILPPANEEEGHGMTLSTLGGVLGEANLQAISNMPLFVREKGKPLNYGHYVLAPEFDKLSNDEDIKRRREAGAVGLAEYEKLAGETDQAELAKASELIEQCLGYLREMDEFFRSNAKPDQYDDTTAPALSAIRDRLRDMDSLLGRFRTDVPGSTEVEEVGGLSTGGASVVSAGKVGGSEVMTRESAFRTIETVAKFFAATEPHSPVSFALQQAVRWGRMSLPELLKELIDDRDTRKNFGRLVGLPPDNEES